MLAPASAGDRQDVSVSERPRIGIHECAVVLVWRDEPLVLAPIRLSRLDALRFAANLVAVVDPHHKMFPTIMLDEMESPSDGLEAGQEDKSGG